MIDDTPGPVIMMMATAAAPAPKSSTFPPVLEVDVETAPLGEVEEVICRWAGRIAAATCGWLTALAAFDRREGWSGIGMGSCARWLAWRCGLGLRTAREHLATAHALERLPALRAAFAAGTLSYSKVRAVTRVAEPATEQTWLTHARFCSAGQISPEEGARLIAALDAARASLEDTTPPPAGTRTNDDAAGGGGGAAGDRAAGDRAAGDGEADGAGVEALPADGERVTTSRDRQRDADALVALAEGFLDRPAPGLTTPGHTLTVHLTTRPDSNAQPGVEGDASAPDVNDRTAGDAAGLPATPLIGIGAWAGVDGGIGLSPQVVQRLGCDGMIRALLTDPDGNPLHLGRRQRHPGPRLRDAVYARDQGRCQYPGCGHTRWLQTHHLTDWVEGGDTDIDRLLLLCTAHHHAIHDEHIHLDRTPDGTVTARIPDGRALTDGPPILPGPEPATMLARATRHVTATAIHTEDGGRLSLLDSIHALLNP
ncbi:HNH endonuclease [Frankia alni]|uniref:HNH endonuclease n=1 Tax=Frankia alni TaxID=1859 RepID=UPI00068596E7|nr:HNH endonuclease signature motif containing protein [Frankia alni]